MNNRMPAQVVSRAGDVLNDTGTALRGARIHLLGVAYKPGVNDARESPAVAVAEQLLRDGADLTYTDPYLDQVVVGGHALASVEPTSQLLAECDLTLLSTAHPDVDYDQVVADSRRVLDATGTLRTRTSDVTTGKVVLL